MHNFIFARSALLFGNFETVPCWLQACTCHSNPCPCGAAYIVPDRECFIPFVLCCSHRKGRDFSSQSNQSFYQTSLPKCLQLLAFVSFISGSNIVQMEAEKQREEFTSSTGKTSFQFGTDTPSSSNSYQEPSQEKCSFPSVVTCWCTLDFFKLYLYSLCYVRSY